MQLAQRPTTRAAQDGFLSIGMLHTYSCALSLTLVCFQSAGVLAADCVSPSNSSILRIEPFQYRGGSWDGDWGDVIDDYIIVGNGYDPEEMASTTIREWTFEEVHPVLDDKHGVFAFFGHGGHDWIDLEPFDFTAGQAADSIVARTQATNRVLELEQEYGASLFGGQTGILLVTHNAEYPNTTSHFGVALRLNVGMDALYEGDNSLVWVGACATFTYNGWGNRGAAAHYVYNYDVLNSVAGRHLSDFLTLWSGTPENLSYSNGLDPVLHRTCRDAYAELKDHYGYSFILQYPANEAPCLALSPAVTEFWQETEWTGSSTNRTARFRWKFDTRVEVAGFSTADALEVDDPQVWITDAQLSTEDGVSVLRANLHSEHHFAGLGAVVVLADKVRSWTNDEGWLNGNTDPPPSEPLKKDWRSGVAPYQDDYDRDIEFPDNPIATVIGLSVANELAHWHTLSEEHSLGYRIWGGDSPFGPWEDTGISDGPGVGRHEVGIGSSSYDFFRLVEVDSSGSISFCGMNSRTPPASLIDIYSNAEGDNVHGETVRPPVEGPSVRSQGNGETVVIYLVEYEMPRFFWDLMYDYVKPYWEGLGYAVVIERYPPSYSEQEQRTAIKNSIASHAAAGVAKFLLVGDANDATQFVGSEVPIYWNSPEWESKRQSALITRWPGQPSLNILPTWVVANNESPPLDLWTHDYPYYFSDQLYGDLDGDGLMDVSVTRWPVNEQEEALDLIIKAMEYVETPRAGLDFSVTFFVDDQNSSAGSNDGDLAKACYEEIEGMVPGGIPTYSILSTQYPSDYDRLVAGVNLWNRQGGTLGPAELVCMIGTNSNGYSPASYFQRSFEEYPFHIGLLSVNAGTPVLIGASCLCPPCQCD